LHDALPIFIGFGSTGEISYLDPVVGLIVIDITIDVTVLCPKLILNGISFVTVITRIYLHTEALLADPRCFATVYGASSKADKAWADLIDFIFCSKVLQDSN